MSNRKSVLGSDDQAANAFAFRHQRQHRRLNRRDGFARSLNRQHLGALAASRPHQARWEAGRLFGRCEHASVICLRLLGDEAMVDEVDHVAI